LNWFEKNVYLCLLLQYNHASLQQLMRIDRELTGRASNNLHLHGQVIVQVLHKDFKGKESSWKNVLTMKKGLPVIRV